MFAASVVWDRYTLLNTGMLKDLGVRDEVTGRWGGGQRREEQRERERERERDILMTMIV